jgi:SPP1 family predicted phage head-tail adaptor
MPPSTRIQAGQLRHRIKIMGLTNVQGPLGGTSPDNYSLFLETWASVSTLTGAEKYAASEQTPLITHKITMRYAPGISSRQIVLFDDKYFEIQYAMDPDGRHKMLELSCIERSDSTRNAAGGAV